MGLVLIALVALGLGFLLILLLSTSTARRAAAIAEAPPGWLGTLEADSLSRLMTLLLAELAFEVEDAKVSGNTVDLFAVNRAPISGGRLYVRALARPPAAGVGEQELLLAQETARAALAGKALIVTAGRFSPQAQALAKDGAIELVDGPALLALVQKHLPQVAAARTLGG